MAMKCQYRIVRSNNHGNQWYVQWSWIGLIWTYMMDPTSWRGTDKYSFRNEADAEFFIKRLIDAQNSKNVKRVYK